MAYVNNQPYGRSPYGQPVVAQPQRTGEWQHGFCSCFEQPLDCLTACCCLPLYASVAAKSADENTACSVCHGISIACIYQGCPIVCPLMFLRKRMREERGIDGNVCNDCLLALCCSCCAYIQLKREVDPEGEKL